MNRFLPYFFLLVIIPICGFSQRNYSNQSVLAINTWYKIAVDKEGVYKVDASFLKTLGITSQNFPSNSIRLFGNGGGMLAENNLSPRIDDLFENAIQVVDGGDGIFNENDYFLFYSTGPDVWLKDSVNKDFLFQKNIYTSACYYFISVGGVGKRVQNNSFSGVPNVAVTSYDERMAHEVDNINFLKSGKQWFGEEFSSTPGNSTTRTFNYDLPGLITNSAIRFKTSVVARSVGAPSRFDIRFNGNPVTQLTIPPVSGNFLESFAVENTISASVPATQSSIAIVYNFLPGTFNAQGWLNWFTFLCRRNLNVQGISQQSFRDWASVGAGNVAGYEIATPTLTSGVWEVTNSLEPINMNRQGSATFSFINDASRLREYFYFNGVDFLTPMAVGRVNNQNLHQVQLADYIVVTHPLWKSEANRLAAFHSQNSGLRLEVSTTEEIYNEFASGSPDPTAIRDFVKMSYDKAGSDSSKRPKYLLLFGDASFDYKNRLTNNTNFVPAYQSVNSLDPLATYTSDDFFGLLDDVDDINLTSPAGLLDIGIGRVPVSNAAEAKVFVDKVIHYHSSATLGSWRNQLTFIADDEDANLHLNDAEIISGTVSAVNPLFNLEKIYVDAYQQESGSGGSRYPAVNQAIVNKVNNGNLIWNYSGHGGSLRLAEEAVLDQDVIRQFNNENKLPLMITATCDFAPYDDPGIKSIGENLLLANKEGAIALTTTTRLVFAFSNRIINNNYLQFALQRTPQQKYRSLGEAMRTAKNFTLNASGDVVNNRKFTLLGDPAMTLAFPELKVLVTGINGNPSSISDTLKALDECTVTGIITDGNQNHLTNFNGTVYPSIYDKAVPVTTLANDASSIRTSFSQQTNVIYKGKATVTNGSFSFTFIVPKDINYQVDSGRMSLYADNGSQDGNGIFTNFKIGGAGTGAMSDNEGPSIKAYLNDENFVNGGLVNSDPVLILQLKDSSGINTTGTGIGHDITATIDGDDKNLLVLNDFYEADLDNFRKGTARYQLPALEPGNHQLKIKAWDVANNSNQTILDFVVASTEKIQLRHVLNYPNPFTSKTNFWFEHNQPASSLKVRIHIYSISGKLFHQIQKTITTEGNRSTEIEWDGKDNFGNRVGRGVYIYSLSVIGTDGSKANAMEKLYIL